MSDHVDADEVAALGKALAGEEPSAPVEERYPEAPPEVAETIELVEERLADIEERLAEKERQREKRAEFVVDLVEKVEDVEEKLSSAEQHYGI